MASAEDEKTEVDLGLSYVNVMSTKLLSRQSEITTKRYHILDICRKVESFDLEVRS